MREQGHTEYPDIHQTCLGPDRASMATPEIEEANHEEDNCHEHHARVVDCSTTKLFLLAKHRERKFGKYT